MIFFTGLIRCRGEIGNCGEEKSTCEFSEDFKVDQCCDRVLSEDDQLASQNFEWISITSDFLNNLTSSSLPWFVIICDRKSWLSETFSGNWETFERNRKYKLLDLNLGKIDMIKNKRFLKQFNLKFYPSFLYIFEGFAYSYTGTIDSENLEKVFSLKLFYQYHRQVLVTDFQDVSQSKTFKKSLNTPTSPTLKTFMYSMTGLFIIQILLLKFCCSSFKI
jgi:hypothetical protein